MAFKTTLYQEQQRPAHLVLLDPNALEICKEVYIHGLDATINEVAKKQLIQKLIDEIVSGIISQQTGDPIAFSHEYGLLQISAISELTDMTNNKKTEKNFQFMQ